MVPSTGEAEAKKTDKTPAGPEMTGRWEPDSKQVTALIYQVIIDGDELRRI